MQALVDLVKFGVKGRERSLLRAITPTGLARSCLKPRQWFWSWGHGHPGGREQLDVWPFASSAHLFLTRVGTLRIVAELCCGGLRRRSGL
jgi:hypothetical protein